ncbi:unnamed protein product [Calypogeia fissa]
MTNTSTAIMTNTSTEPLLSRYERNGTEVSRIEECSSGEESEAEESGWLVAELWKQFWLAGPMVCVGLLQYSLHLISVMFVGHLGKLELASASIAISFAGVTGFSLLIGMACALETLCGQAYGAKQYHLLGIHMQRAILVLNITSIPIAFIWLSMGPLLLALGQDPEISEYAGQYARWMLPSLFAYATLQPVVKFLQTQSAVLPMALCSAVTLCIHLPLCYMLIFKLGVGYRGAAIAIGMSQWLNVIFLVSYVKLSPSCKETWTGFSTKAFRDMNVFFKLAVPSAVMVCLEYWSFEFIVLMSGLLPNPQLEMAVLSISLNSIALMGMIPGGLGASASTRVSNELGAGKASAGQKAAAVGFSLGVGQGLIVSSIAFAARHVWAYAFTSEPEVVDYVAKIMPFLSVLTILDSCQTVLSGVTRGSGNQALGAYTNLAAFYIVGLPLAIMLAFHYNLSGKGLWIGMIAALAVQTLALGAMAMFSNWEKQAEDALGRVYTDQLPTDKTEGPKARHRIYDSNGEP